MSTEQELSRDELPDEYVPVSLVAAKSRPRPVRYGVGIRTGVSNMGMTHGPFPSLQSALDVVPGHAASCVIRFNSDGTEEVLYRWNRAGTRWVRAKGTG